jgi:hypothetical protein
LRINVAFWWKEALKISFRCSSRQPIFVDKDHRSSRWMLDDFRQIDSARLPPYEHSRTEHADFPDLLFAPDGRE